MLAFSRVFPLCFRPGFILQQLFLCNFILHCHGKNFTFFLCWRCEDTQCVCDEGWTGSRCENQACDPRCSLHGQCKNGTCLCVTGWNGKHCTLEGCPDECSSPRQGVCRANFRGEWSCDCKDGWEGDDCSVRLESYCDDGADNDQGKLNNANSHR